MLRCPPWLSAEYYTELFAALVRYSEEHPEALPLERLVAEAYWTVRDIRDGSNRWLVSLECPADAEGNAVACLICDSASGLVLAR